MAALVQRQDSGRPALFKEKISLPQIEPHQSLVKISHAAQNPTDVQSLDRNAFGDGTVLGCDFVGTVESVGKDVTRVAKGDVIAGLVWGGEYTAKEITVKYTNVMQARSKDSVRTVNIPSPTNASASSVPLAAATAWLAFFSKDCLNIDRNHAKQTILIWGGSSSVGLYAIQIAALHNITVIATCSPRTFDLLNDHGATHVFDYSDPDIVTKIKDVASGLTYVFDTIGNEKSSATASQAIKESGGSLCTVRPGKAHCENVAQRVRVTDVLVWTAFLKEHRYGDFHWPAHKEDHELASELFEKLPGWLESGTIRPNPTRIRKGLDTVVEGFQEYRDGHISAYKIVYEV
ncbi:NAD(P)-binding protein [Massarina eburnea CBS 473.64]|uniref:NAD(P)-binding protein n=1 Tax=Massarina eburnea CBS 473.64 TaxID=1395130 RepID=A0A6A6RI86_9PLEO|nr:NAD(P)-binding protein [Massarina eburnea CBS 473.64]